MSIETLVRESKAGNASAFHALYNELASKVFLFVRSKTRARDDALDILQDTFVEFWNSLHGFAYASEAGLKSYLYTIAIRRISKYYQNSKKPNELISVEDIADFLPDDSQPESKEEIKDVVRTLHTLNEKDREIIELRYFSGLPFADIASLLNEQESAVKVRHHRALEKIRTTLDYE